MHPDEKPWSLRAAQAPQRDADTQEALSGRFGSRSLVVLPLQSGRLAIFKRDFQLLAIADQVDFVDWWTYSAEAKRQVDEKAEGLRQAAGSAGVRSTETKAEEIF